MFFARLSKEILRIMGVSVAEINSLEAYFIPKAQYELKPVISLQVCKTLTRLTLLPERGPDIAAY